MSGSAVAILVVDDNPAKRLSIASVLSSLGHEIVEADSGEEALHAVMERAFAVILMDVQMPDMDGYETARMIRLRWQSEHTPIIFITAHAEDETHVPSGYASGAVDFIFAPVVPEVLRAKVSIFVDLFRKSREIERTLDHITTLSERFRDSEVRTRSVLDNVADAIVTTGEEGTIESFNRAATTVFGYTEKEAIGQPFSLMVTPAAELLAPGGAAAANPPHKHGTSIETVGRRKNGGSFPVELDLSHVQIGDRTVHIACLRDISERHAQADTLRHAALHDGLTALPNRVLFSDRVNHAIRAAERTQHPLALLVMDLNGFKRVNDTLGHRHGDTLLKLVADRLLSCLRDGDTVARLGGDEFGILPAGPTDLAGAAAVAWKIQQAFEAPFVVNSHPVEVGASIGIALVPDHGNSIDNLLRRADLAMYHAKRSGTGYSVFASDQEEAPARRLALLGDLRRCVERGELVLHYQPKVDLSTLETIGVEALVRWNHPSGKLLSPGEFMHEVERSDELMASITHWVVKESLRTLQGWRGDGYDLSMAINIGARCLSDGTAMFDTIDELAVSWGIPPDKLTFELTESALIDTSVPDLAARLESMDERLSIDDFGTGYSSLVYLQRLPVVEIKADKTFVSSMHTVKDDAVIVRSIIDLAHNLSAQVVAEGVEHEETMALLIEYGCDTAQGYYFSRPLPADDLVRWLQSSKFGLPRRLGMDAAPAVKTVAAASTA